MSESELFFLSEAIRHAHSLLIPDAILFLEGMARSVGHGHPGYAQIMSAREHFIAGEEQLELIASGQLNFGALLG